MIDGMAEARVSFHIGERLGLGLGLGLGIAKKLDCSGGN